MLMREILWQADGVTRHKIRLMLPGGEVASWGTLCPVDESWEVSVRLSLSLFLSLFLSLSLSLSLSFSLGLCVYVRVCVRLCRF